MKVFVDTNIILDSFLVREPFAQDATAFGIARKWRKGDRAIACYFKKLNLKAPAKYKDL